MLNSVEIKQMGFEPFDPNLDYFTKIPQEDIYTEGESKFVFLRGLEKLAKTRGVKCFTSSVTPLITANGSLVGAVSTVRYEFWDGSIFEGSSDATPENMKGVFSSFPVPISESRSKARALRNAFFISACSFEERGASPESYMPSAGGKIEDYQVVAIEQLMERAKLSLKEVLAKGTKRAKVSKLEDLTRDEGRALIVTLNQCIASLGRSKHGPETASR